MRQRSTLLLVAWLVMVCGWALSVPARASTEDCIQCKHVDCIKGLIKQKKAMAAGYDALAHKWDPLVKVEGAPAEVVDFNTIADPRARTDFYRDLMDKLDAFGRQENELASEVGSAPGCGDFKVNSNTDSYRFCKVDPASLALSKGQAPCRQIGELLEKHENLHRDRCIARKRGPNFHMWQPLDHPVFEPGIMQTPGGHAREEASAYRMEIAALELLLPKAQAKCELRFSGVTTSCTIPSPGGKVEMGQDIAGKVCGNPLTGSWTINTVSWVRAPYIGLQRNIDPPWASDCVAKGSPDEARRAEILSAGPGAGWMCVYDDSTPPKIIIRSFRLKQCVPQSEQTFIKTATRSECEGDKPAPPTPEPPTDVPVS